MKEKARSRYMPGRPGLSARAGNISVPVFLPSLLLFFLLFIPTLALPQSVDLPLVHWGYPLLDRLEAKGLFHLPGYDAKPLTRQQVADALRQIDQQADRLSPVDRALIEELKGEFVEELEGTEVPVSDEEREPHLVTARRRMSFTALDGRVDQRMEWIGGETRRDVNRTVIGLSGRGRWFRIAAFSGELQGRVIRGMGPTDNVVDRARGLLTSLDERNTTRLEASGSLVFQYQWLQGYLGKGVIRWGPGLRSHLIVSDQAPAYPMIKLTSTFRRLKFTYFHGFLIRDGSRYVPGHPLNLPARRYIAGHRVDLNFWSRFRFGVQETIVYGNRGVEPLYVVPVTIYYVTEPRIGHDDERHIALDMAVTPRQNLRVYSQFLVNDWSINNVNHFFRPFSWHSNRWGVMVGLWLLNPGTLQDTDLRIEYTRVEPYVYTQRKPWNITQYQRRHLGSFLQPNSDNLFIEGRYRPTRSIALGISGQRTRHADRGDGNIYGPDNPPISHGGRKQFLGGVVERTTSVGVGARYEPLRRQFLSLQYTYVRAGNVDFVAQTTGRTTTDHRLLLSTSLEY